MPPPDPLTMPSAPPTRARIVIVGAGFGGLAAAATLAKAEADITVIDRRNYHLFQPLLYQVATCALSPAEIAGPIRAILARQANTRVVLARVEAVDTARRVVKADGMEFPYEFLVLATGARHAYFGHDEWEGVAPGLKKIEDATLLRRRILLAFERAELTADAEEQRRLLTFAIIGAGPTGVEMAGAIAELARTLARDFRNFDANATRVLLIEAGSRVLPSFPESLSAAALAQLRGLGVEVMLGQPVTHCDAHGVTMGAARVPAGTLIWAAGVAASSAAKWIGADKDRAGRIKVNPDLTAPGHADIFAVGDTAALTDAAGKVVPGVAPAAKQMGKYAARVILARLGGTAAPPPFRYRDYGNLATIGRRAAVADFGFMHMRGLPAWLLWGAAHVYFLIGFRNRAVVLLNWIWAYLTFRRGTRLITEGPDQR